jgi:hypothetical protein
MIDFLTPPPGEGGKRLIGGQLRGIQFALLQSYLQKATHYFVENSCGTPGFEPTVSSRSWDKNVKISRKINPTASTSKDEKQRVPDFAQITARNTSFRW